MANLTSISRQGKSVPDDRVRPETKWTAAVVVVVLVAAFIDLFFWPDDTDRLFAWAIKPRMSSLVLSTAYIAAAYFYARVATASRWHHVALGLLPTTAFTWLIAIATLLHLDRFNQTQIWFWVWVVVYGATPLVVPWLWLRNRAADPGTLDPQDATLPRPVRLILGGVFILYFALGLLLFFFPDLAITIWPWKLTVLTARVLGCLFVAPGVAGVAVAFDARWSAWRIGVQSELIRLVFTLVIIVRAWGDFNSANPLTWIFLGNTIVSLIGFSILYFSMESRRRRMNSPASIAKENLQ